MERAGQLLQADGSRHRWFGPDHPFATLVGAIDDATSVVTGGTFRTQEDAAGYLEVLTQTSRGPGLPWTFYTDHHGIFERDPREAPTIPEQLAGDRTPDAGGTGPAGGGHRLAARLVTRGEGSGGAAVGHGPGPARGHGAATGRHHDHRRGRTPSCPAGSTVTTSGSRCPRPIRCQPGERGPRAHPAEAVFAFWYRRTVARDNTVAWDGRALSLPRRSDGRSRAGREITVAERLDGSLWAELEGIWQPLAVSAPPSAPELRARQGPSRRRHPRRHAGRGRDVADKQRRNRERPLTPAADHPWRQPSRPR